MIWQISVPTSAEAEEAVVELLERLFRQPATVRIDQKTRKITAVVYCLRDCAWSPGKRRALLAGLRRIQALGLPLQGKISAAKLPAQNWAESWKKHFKPLEIGGRLLIRPSWSRQKPKQNQSVIVLDPGLSFGTGHHPTTAFCLEQLAACPANNRRQLLFDIGTGSGILAIAAAKLGYRRVVAIDVDPVALRIARANAEGNGVGRYIEFQRQDLARLNNRNPPKYDLICANLSADLLLEHRNRIVGRLRPDGVLIMAGILAGQFAQLRVIYCQAGLHMTAHFLKQEWHSAVFRVRC